jgi:uncharacterized lipoprotein YmbA
MRLLRAAICAPLAAVLLSCAGAADHFYTLSVQPDAARAPAAFTAHVILNTSVPAVVDRRQMVVQTSGDQLLILEHERWAAPLSELLTQTLARDIEQRRPGVLVGNGAFGQSNVPAITVNVDVVQMSARKGSTAMLEAHWRIVEPATNYDQLGGELFTAPLNGGEYSAIAQALSACLASLADRIAQKLPIH